MGYLNKTAVNLRRKRPTNFSLSLSDLEHAVQLKRIEIENHKRCYPDLQWQPTETQSTYNRHLTKLENELQSLENSVALHPESGVL